MYVNFRGMFVIDEIEVIKENEALRVPQRLE